MSPPPFVIFALPRCRTAWLSRFLSYGQWSCGHEQARYVRSVDDIRSWLSTPFTGTAETAAAPFWRTLRDIAPDTRVVVVRRPVDEVVDSLMAQCPFDRAALTAQIVALDHKLSQIAARWPGALSVTFASLRDEATCARVFEHCLQRPHDPVWWRLMDSTNVQINLPAMVRYHTSHRPQIEKITAILRRTTLDKFETRTRDEHEALTLTVEPFATFYPEARRAFEAHLAATDQLPDPDLKNIALLQRLDDIGALQCVAARSNGRVFGYLMTLISPSLDDHGAIRAHHMPFYADTAFPGLGMRLQRFARDALKERGVTEIIMHAGVRGSGPRLGTLYRRLGAEDFGQLYRLNME
jgi:hypothetical protein